MSGMGSPVEIQPQPCAAQLPGDQSLEARAANPDPAFYPKSKFNPDLI